MSTALVFAMTFGATLGAAVVALGLDAFGRRNAAIATVAVGLAIAAFGGVGSGVERAASVRVGTFAVGGPASMVFGVIALVGLLAVVGGMEGLRERVGGGSSAAVIALSVAASGGAAATLDLTTLFLTLETAALCGYGLVALGRTVRSGEAAIKYFVQGAIATGLLLFGIAVLVGLVEPSGRYDAFTEAFAGSTAFFPALAGVGLILTGLLFKMGAVPFHSWAPDVYETAPEESAAFLAAGPKLAAIAAAAILLSVSGSGVMAQRFLVVTAALAVVSVLVGSIAALRQRSYRRLLAYAGIAQSGYALIAVALFAPPLAVFFGATYALAATGTFLSAAAFSRMLPEWDGSLEELSGFARRAPRLCAALAVLLVSLAGLPPFLGFWGKLLVFGTGISASVSSAGSSPSVMWAMGIAVSAGILGSVVSLGYYGRILRTLYFESPSEKATEPAQQAEAGARWAVGAVIAIAILVVVLSLVPLLLGTGGLFDLFAAA